MINKEQKPQSYQTDVSGGTVNEPSLDVQTKTTHQIWHKFSNWMVKTFGKDLHGEWEFMEVTGNNGEKVKLKHRSFND
jgi:hypothetical protein